MTVFFLLAGCIGKVETDSSRHQQMVLEGRIESGSGAEVQLTTNISYTDTISEDVIYDAVIRWAKVTLTSGAGESEILTAYRSDDYASGFVYRSNKIRGRAGEIYTVRVDYSGVTITSETSIPAETVEIDKVECIAVDDTCYTVKFHFQDPPSKNAYFFECKTGDVKYFRPAMLGILDDSLFPGGDAVVTVNRPFNTAQANKWNPYFRRDEEVTIRFSTLGEFGHKYWSQYENEALNALNPIFPADNNLPTNINGDGRGIWCGYVSRCFSVSYPQ